LKILEATKNIVLDTLFPVSCISCGKPQAWLCENCLNRISLKAEQVCPYCEIRITPNGYACFDCKKKFSLDGLLVATSYQDKTISNAIHLYKYRFVEDLSHALGDIMLRTIGNSELPLPDIIIPIPLHKRRLRWRGFNQSELIAKYIAEKITPGFPIAVENNLLERFRYTHPQMEIKNQAQRKKNIEKAFKIPQNKLKLVKNKRILLVDDVTTTGATIFECAKTLKKSGASEVFATVIARQG
jgi:ComF family protein